MLRQPTNPNANDIARLRDEGYNIQVRSGYLLVHDVPYVTSDCRVERGTLVAPLNMPDGQTTAPPNSHVVSFTGAQPCHRDGRPIMQIMHATSQSEPVPGVVVQRAFSNKPPNGYPSYYAMMTRYIEMISAPAESLEPGTTACTFPPHLSDPDDESPFVYVDTASSRAGISDITRRLALSKVAIVGIGGTGSYVLDLVAKTPVREIHLYDGDRFVSHNTFRAPGAASLEVLRESLHKVNYFAGIYSTIHRGIKPHPVYVDSSNAGELASMDFVFVCLDKGEPKRHIVEQLEAAGVPFVDAGLGLDLDHDRKLGGQIRVTTSTNADRGALHQHVSFTDRDEEEDLYDQNIQVADLNMLNAAFAVMRWKRLFGFYRDAGSEHHSVYVIDDHNIIHASILSEQ